MDIREGDVKFTFEACFVSNCNRGYIVDTIFPFFFPDSTEKSRVFLELGKLFKQIDLHTRMKHICGAYDSHLILPDWIPTRFILEGKKWVAGMDGWIIDPNSS